MGLHDGTWPTAPTPNPFIPLQQQRQYQMPHSSHAREFNFCQRLTQRLCDSAPIIVLSYPQQQGDEHLRPSPLIKHFNRGTPLTATHETLAELLQRHGQLETLLDDHGPAVATHEKIKGGSGLFKDQGACPFRAFARYRLGATSPASVSNYLTAQDRGILLHQILERLWSHLQSQQQLLVLPEHQLKQLCDAIITAALNTLPHLKPKFRQLEQERLQNILQNWLAHEKARPSFTVIAREQWRQINLGGINVRLQVDRIDQIQQPNQAPAQVIIDYKTGKTNIRGWLGERPDEPQLPLYTVTNEEPIAGTVFAGLRADEMGFSGITQTAGLITKVPGIDEFDDEDIPATWPELLAQWRRELEQLAKEFCEGYAAVSPKYGAQTCQYCDLMTLCRVK
jgi:probable DNA repair protein